MVHRRLHVVVSVVDVAVHVLKRTLGSPWRSCRSGYVSAQLRVVLLHVSILVLSVAWLVLARLSHCTSVASTLSRTDSLGGDDVRSGVVQDL